MAAFRIVFIAALWAASTCASAHGGGLDAYGCHHNRKAGGYHCHAGSLAKKSFMSKDDMIAALKGFKADQDLGAASAETLSGEVISIADGDTLTVLVAGKAQYQVRLLDIDAPERGQAFSTSSQQALAALCFHKTAAVWSREYDQYGRILARVTCGGIDANAALVRQGMAWVFVRYAPKDSPLYAIQAEARAAKRGLWQDAGPVPPWEWRRANR